MASRTALRLRPHALISAAPPLSAVAAHRFASTQAKGKGKAKARATSTASASSSSSSTAAAAAAKAQPQDREVLGTKEDPYAVPPLSRPLGSLVEPSTDKITWQKRREQLLDQDRRKAERKALIKEASQGYFHDYNLARRANGGKLFVGPPVLIREDAALYFPNITGKALTGAEVHTTDLFRGKVSLVTILNTRISEEHVQSFVEPVLEDWEGQPFFNYVQINHQDNKLKSLLVSFMTSGLKRTIPEERWGTYMISSGEWSPIDITGPLGMENKLLGYVFLVDENAKVRWAGCGTAQPKEVDDLRRAAAVLIRRKLGDKAVAGSK